MYIYLTHSCVSQITLTDLVEVAELLACWSDVNIYIIILFY